MALPPSTWAIWVAGTWPVCVKLNENVLFDKTHYVWDPEVTATIQRFHMIDYCILTVWHVAFFCHVRFVVQWLIAISVYSYLKQSIWHRVKWLQIWLRESRFLDYSKLTLIVNIRKSWFLTSLNSINNCNFFMFQILWYLFSQKPINPIQKQQILSYLQQHLHFSQICKTVICSQKVGHFLANRTTLAAGQKDPCRT